MRRISAGVFQRPRRSLSPFVACFLINADKEEEGEGEEEDQEEEEARSA